MTTTKQSSSSRPTYIFNVEIMIEDGHHTNALEKLLHGLNSCDWQDYRIISGIQLGQEIEQKLAKAFSFDPIPVAVESPASSPEPGSDSTQSESPGLDQIRSFMKNNTLIRLIVNRGLGIKLNIPCRIINMEDRESLITVYHVDEKQVYTFRLNEIEDFIG